MATVTSPGGGGGGGGGAVLLADWEYPRAGGTTVDVLDGIGGWDRLFIEGTAAAGDIDLHFMRLRIGGVAEGLGRYRGYVDKAGSGTLTDDGIKFLRTATNNTAQMDFACLLSKFGRAVQTTFSSQASAVGCHSGSGRMVLAEAYDGIEFNWDVAPTAGWLRVWGLEGV